MLPHHLALRSVQRANIPEHPGAFLAGDQGFFDITREPTYLVRAGPARPGTAYGDYLFRSLSEAESYARQIANTGEGAIRDISSLPRVYPKGAPVNPVDAMYIYGPIPENTPNIIGVTDEQTEGGTVFGNPLIYRGGGPQVVIPNNMGFGFPD